MNYRMIKEQVLKLLNQYTIAGTPVAATYNNQQDYLNRIPSLCNDAMLEIATTVRKLPAMMTLENGEEFGDMVRYSMPEDFYQFSSGDTLATSDGHILHTNRFMLHGKQYLLVPKEEAGNHVFVYYRYPRLLAEDPADDEMLDGDPETHFAIPFYVASLLAAHDDPYLCSLLMNKYEDKLRKMMPKISAEGHAVQDAYGNTWGGAY